MAMRAHMQHLAAQGSGQPSQHVCLPEQIVPSKNGPSTLLRCWRILLPCSIVAPHLPSPYMQIRWSSSSTSSCFQVMCLALLSELGLSPGPWNSKLGYKLIASMSRLKCVWHMSVRYGQARQACHLKPQCCRNALNIDQMATCTSASRLAWQRCVPAQAGRPWLPAC